MSNIIITIVVEDEDQKDDLLNVLEEAEAEGDLPFAFGVTWKEDDNG